MSRISGRRGRIYLGATNGAAASPVTAQASWSISYTTDALDVSAMGDSNKQYVSGLADVGGSFNGFFDMDVVGTELYSSATDGLERNFYCYPDLTNAATKYFHGKVVLSDFAVEAGVDGAATVNSTWKAASAIILKTS